MQKNMRMERIFLLFLVMLFPLTGCVGNDADEISTIQPDGSCFALLQTSMESMDAPGIFMSHQNYSYDSDCRVVSVESSGWNFLNTSYDANGHPVVITATTSVDGGVTWTSIDTNQTWANGLMTQTETMGIETNYTYDTDGRVTVQETLHSTYLNTTYDVNGNPTVLSTSTTVDGGATWITIDTNQTWINGLMTQTETMGIETNYTYDADGRVTGQESLHSTYVNTTYDAVHGEVSYTETALTIDGGANWVVIRNHHTWGQP
ncbi:MAG: hypothetical protein CMA73_07685 [Euryarchaeota archaeon]|nr:hypothetical protein [Euryarchaeota archaeon]|tara:strand:+ start:91 stop:876 length:786 start_codon:yes stop_codon:yes gene_type:complete